MFKNQLQELAQRSCFNLPSYTCIREGPDHAPRFKATVNFNGEVFESPTFCSTLRLAEHAAAEAALNTLSNRGPSHSLAARILDETGVYKNLLQEISRRVGVPLPSYSTVRSGFGHQHVFTCTVQLAGFTFTGGPAKSKKQAEKNSAMAAWNSLKKLAKEAASSSSEPENNDEQVQTTIARTLLNYRLEMMANKPIDTSFSKSFTALQQAHLNRSRILPLMNPKSVPRIDGTTSRKVPYVLERHHGVPLHAIAPPVRIRTAVPVFSAPPCPHQESHQPHSVVAPPFRRASPVVLRPVVPLSAAQLSSQAVSSKVPSQKLEQTAAFIAYSQVEPADRVKDVQVGWGKE
ncbi:hypothetical protein HPP92_011033 [Vanilla planifolia]|uniref:DRBM domain-containing protein n=1 Tax=Vanilla planifolia TaxID=51239 RepID=A0A835V0N2_VANPL|nr:hypothetical protein HPP92_011033 [Vanilla planifolia]